MTLREKAPEVGKAVRVRLSVTTAAIDEVFLGPWRAAYLEAASETRFWRMLGQSVPARDDDVWEAV